jgi:hypothetical protein
MRKNFWEFIFQPEVIFYVIAIIAGIAIAILSIIPGLGSQIVLATILLVLSFMIPLLLSNCKKMSEIESNILVQQGNRIVLQPFRRWRDEIRININDAQEIWILSKTGRGWWRDYLEEKIESSNQMNRFRLIFLDPNGDALGILEKNRKEWEPEEKDIKNEVSFLYTYLVENHGKMIDLKVVDRFFPWTLLIINPTKENRKKMMYVALESFQLRSGERPIFKLTAANVEYFDYFLNGFSRTWEVATTWRIAGKIQPVN